jgi:hypothetical protein
MGRWGQSQASQGQSHHQPPQPATKPPPKAVLPIAIKPVIMRLLILEQMMLALKNPA